MVHGLNKLKQPRELEMAICIAVRNDKFILIRFNLTDEKHMGSCNMECKNAAIYKHFVRKSIKILGHYVKFVSHPKSLNGKFKPNHEELVRLGFADIHTALADTVENLQMSTMGETYNKKDVDKLLATAKNEVKKEMVTMKDIITTKTKIFMEKTVEESSFSFR